MTKVPKLTPTELAVDWIEHANESVLMRHTPGALEMMKQCGEELRDSHAEHGTRETLEYAVRDLIAQVQREPHGGITAWWIERKLLEVLEKK